MPKIDRSSQINVVLKPEVLARLRIYLAERGQTLTHVVERALVRHLASPPPLVPDPPLPPAPPEMVVNTGVFNALAAPKKPGRKRT